MHRVDMQVRLLDGENRALGNVLFGWHIAHVLVVSQHAEPSLLVLHVDKQSRPRLCYRPRSACDENSIRVASFHFQISYGNLVTQYVSSGS